MHITAHISLEFIKIIKHERKRHTVLFVRGMLYIIYGLDDLLNLMYAFTAPKGMYSRVQVFLPCINMKLKLTDLVKVSCQLLGVMK